jgi:hypothetical protein
MLFPNNQNETFSPFHNITIQRRAVQEERAVEKFAMLNMTEQNNCPLYLSMI